MLRSALACEKLDRATDLKTPCDIGNVLDHHVCGETPIIADSIRTNLLEHQQSDEATHKKIPKQTPASMKTPGLAYILCFQK